MAKPSVYLETSVISYAISRSNRDLVIAARQQITRDGFASRSTSYSLFVSQLVAAEVAAGDESAAVEREAFLQGIPRLATTGTAGTLASELLARRAVPVQAAEDALHIALAAVHGVEYLLTWNCKHIANATMRQAIERACRGGWLRAACDLHSRGVDR